jgi:predicted small secreted protein
LNAFSNDLSDYCLVKSTLDTDFPESYDLAWIVLIMLYENNLIQKRRRTMRSIMFAILMLAVPGMNVACNTVHGIGQDVERAGEKTQDAADNVKKKL